MKKEYWQIIYKEYGRLDDEFNEASSQEIYKTKTEAWKATLQDCETDEDLAYLLNNVSSGVISLRSVLIPEMDNISDKKAVWVIEAHGYGIQEPGYVFRKEKDALQWLEDEYGEKATSYLNTEAVIVKPIRFYTKDIDEDI